MGLIGYARTSATDQKAGLEAQLRELEQAGCARVYQEQVSSVDLRNREQFAAALDYIREGDTLVVTKLDRLARSMAHLMTILEELDKKGAHLRILAMNLDTKSSTGKLMLNVLGSVAQFEREIMIERQMEGIAKAKAQGKYKGRKPTAETKRQEVKALHAEGIGPTEIARRLNLGRATVYRILGADKVE
ncbi:recombinase family protein [Thioclava kandeliae]|uniref:Recombinase family protein n=1 Tax=Thioclava kandeliae TaxID=3070818 RepID=A0ABV1SHT9_9RHOB